jgi:hypothetical protein
MSLKIITIHRDGHLVWTGPADHGQEALQQYLFELDTEAFDAFDPDDLEFEVHYE